MANLMIQIVIRILVSKFRRIHLQSKVRSMKPFSKVLSFFDFSGRNETVFSNLQISSDDIPFPKNQSFLVQVFVSAFLLLTTIFGAILRYFWFYWQWIVCWMAKKRKCLIRNGDRFDSGSKFLVCQLLFNLK